MSLTESMIQGTLNEDGTLDLDTQPDLPPGRVTVILRPSPEPALPVHSNWFQCMQAARKEMEAGGCQFMDEKEMQRHLDWLREGDRIDAMLGANDYDKRGNSSSARN
jgi:hypothetical protein